ncbi:hypothetical protein ACTFIW_012090 [Dictyostelium discoideum]
MSTTVNNNDASSSSTSASDNAESFDLRMKSMEDQINNLSLAFISFMKEPMFSSNTNSRSQRNHDDSETESEQSDDESSNNVDVPTDFQLSDTLLGQYKHMVNNQGLLVEEECILKKDEISELNKVFNFPSNFQVNVAPFSTPEGISVSSTNSINYFSRIANRFGINEASYCCSPRKLAGLKGKLIALKDAVIPFRLYTRRTNKFHSQCLTLANGDWDQSFPIPQDVKSEISHWLTVLNQWNGKEISLFPSAGATLKKGNKIIKTWSFQWSTTQSNMSSNRREMLALLMVYQALWWSYTGPISSVRTTLETMPQEESQLDWRAYSRVLQCKSRPPQPSFRDESQIFIQSNQELQLATEDRSVQSNPTSVRSNTDGSVRISPEPSNEQLLNNQNECTPPRLESMEAMFSLPTTNSFAFYPGEDELIQFEEGFYNTDLPNLEISNLVSDDSSTSSSSSSSHVSSSTGNIPRSIDQTISIVNTNPNSTTLETRDYSTFQSHVMSIIRIKMSSTSELLMKFWEPSTLKVYSSSYTRFRNFCTLNSLNPAKITLVVFMDYLTHLFKHKPPLAFSTINGHRSMLNQLLLLENQTDIVNDQFITRIMTGIHKLRPSSAKYQEIWDSNQVFKHLSTIKVIPKYTYTALLKKKLVLYKMFVNWSFNDLIITPDSIKGPVINAKEQRKGVLSILELTSLDDTNSQVCPVRHLSTYLRASKGRRKPHYGDSVFIKNEGKPLDVKGINIIVLSTLSSSGIDISKFKSHSTLSAMASLLLSNNVPFHVVKKMGRWKSNDTVDTLYDKRIIGE